MAFKNTLREGLNDCIEQSSPTYYPPNVLEEFPKFPSNGHDIMLPVC